MTEKHGFILLREEHIAEYDIRALFYQHRVTGAEVLSLASSDENKVFGITFKTPPQDSTGIAHILEHSVFCGSKKFPVKEPFVELLKGSLQTFLNAFTYPDKTCYPVASQNLQDYYNLIDIYMDAVLNPILDHHTFKQEGWHYELENPDDTPIFKGVVFNEMKGVYASADNLLSEHSQRILFPTATYGLDSGGDPKHIPDLTWDALKAFHTKFYHPSNARIFFYGDDDPDERLRLMDTYLRGYAQIKVDSDIPAEDNSVALPAEVTEYYPVSKEDTDAEIHLTVNWRMPEHDDAELSLGLYLLDHILTDSPASPLKKKLIESGLGEDIAGVGLETQIRQFYFSTGMKGIQPGNEQRVIDLIDVTLRDLVTNGIDPKTIEAALNTEEFQFRELNTGNYPRGLSIMISALQSWLYGRDPLEPIRFQIPFTSIRKKIELGEKYFERLIEKHLLNNPHRTVLYLKPDPKLRERLEAEETEVLQDTKSSWDHETVEKIIEETRELKKRQSQPDSPEALATIPSLSRKDLPNKNKAIPSESLELEGTPLLFHDIKTQGITYLDIGFNLESVPDDLLRLVPLWSRAVLETGTESEDYIALSQRIGRLTGGIDPEFFTSNVNGCNEIQSWAFLRGKSLNDKLPDLLNIYRDVIDGARLHNRERIQQIITEEKAEQESNLIPSGHRYVSMKVRAQFNMSDWILEQLSGISYLHTLRDLQKQITHNWGDLKERLELLHKILTNRENLFINITADGTSRSSAEAAISAFLKHIPTEELVLAHRTRFGASRISAPEGFAIPSQVNYVAKGMNLHQAGGRVDGAALVASRYLRSTWLWDQVRVQGGAYGGFCSIDHRSGQLTMASYRDPNAARTLDIYDRTADYLSHLKLDAKEVERAVIGTIGDLDTYLLPDAKGYASMCRHLTGDTEERRQRLRSEVMNTRLENFNRFGDQMSSFAREGHIVLMGAEDKIKEVPKIEITRLL